MVFILPPSARTHRPRYRVLAPELFRQSFARSPGLENPVFQRGVAFHLQTKATCASTSTTRRAGHEATAFLPESARQQALPCRHQTTASADDTSCPRQALAFSCCPRWRERPQFSYSRPSNTAGSATYPAFQNELSGKTGSTATGRRLMDSIWPTSVSRIEPLLPPSAPYLRISSTSGMPDR